MDEKKPKFSLRLNIILYGQPALEAKELKQLGMARNNVHLVSQAIDCFYQRTIDDRLKTLRLRAFEKTDEVETER